MATAVASRPLHCVGSLGSFPHRNVLLPQHTRTRTRTQATLILGVVCRCLLVQVLLTWRGAEEARGDDVALLPAGAVLVVVEYRLVLALAPALEADAVALAVVVVGISHTHVAHRSRQLFVFVFARR